MTVGERVQLIYIAQLVYCSPITLRFAWQKAYYNFYDLKCFAFSIIYLQGITNT